MKFIIYFQCAAILLFFSARSSARSIDDEIDETIYDLIEHKLENDYAKDNNTTACIIKYFRDNEIVQKFYRQQLFFDEDLLSSELKPHLPAAEESCSGSGASDKSDKSDSKSTSISLVLLLLGLGASLLPVMYLKSLSPRTY